MRMLSFILGAERLSFRVALALFLGSVCLAGCGGGTEGSGTRAYVGNVRIANGAPVVGALVSIEETGDADITDGSGDFSIDSSAQESHVTFLISGSGLDTSATVDGIADENSKITVQIEIDPATKKAHIEHFAVRAGIVGACDRYFENRDVIRQANQVPNGTICTVKLRVLGDGKPVDRIPVGVQVRGCKDGDIWETVESAETGYGLNAGEAKISFPFVLGQNACSYRVAAPLHYYTYQPVSYPIVTFRDQEPSAR